MAVNPTAPPAEQATDPNSQYVSASAFDLLLIEIVPMAYRLAAELEAREAEFLPPDQTATTTKNKRISGGASATGTAGTAGGTAGGGTTGGTATGTGLEGGPVGEAEDEERREAVYQRLDKLGYRVGLGIVEKFTLTTPRPQSPLDAIKYICRDLWTLLFRKSIDNLKTNHRGIFVLTDRLFHPLRRASPSKSEPQLLAQAQAFLVFPAGVVRGALQGLGFECSVEGGCSMLPEAVFQVRMKGAKA